MAMTRTVGTIGMVLAAMFLVAGSAAAANPPVTADVLGKLHLSNQKEIEMGKQAQANGTAKEVKAYGKTLVKDHSAADKKVTALAKKEKIDLAAATPSAKDDMPAPAAGPDFDGKFGQMMLDDHKKDIAEVTDAKNNTTDEQLKKLLADMLPTLQKHQELAQKIVDGEGKK
jgi:putative membrane protein